MIDPVKQIIVVRKDLITRDEQGMTPGKMGAQIAHASLAPILEKMYKMPFSEYHKNTIDNKEYTLELDLKKGDALKEWLEGDFTKIVLYVKSEGRLLKLYEELKAAGILSCIIKDSGKTIFKEPTITCLGIEPTFHSVIYPHVKRLQLLK